LSNLTHQIAPNTWAIITYEQSWKSYINNYVIMKQDSCLLIDTNLRKHRGYLQQALNEIGVTNLNNVQVFCTHRHSDHIGNVELFRSSNNWIHLQDYFDLDDFSQTLFGHTFTGSEGEFADLQFKQLSFHTNGSVAFFDKETKTCFLGDHLSFFGAPIVDVIGYNQQRREEFYRFITKWKDQDKSQSEAFAEGIRSLLTWPIEILATGHGPILAQDIPDFFRQILAIVDPNP